MDFKKFGVGLGVFSLALGAAELFLSDKITKALDVEGHEGLVKGFGAREVAAGVALLSAPAVSTNVWNRVLGDAMDLTALGVAAAKGSRTKAMWGSLAFVAAATTLDVVTAIGLDKQTGKMEPTRNQLLAAA